MKEPWSSHHCQTVYMQHDHHMLCDLCKMETCENHQVHFWPVQCEWQTVMQHNQTHQNSPRPLSSVTISVTCTKHSKLRTRNWHVRSRIDATARCPRLAVRPRPLRFSQRLKVAVSHKAALSHDLNKSKLTSWLNLINSNTHTHTHTPV